MSGGGGGGPSSSPGVLASTGVRLLPRVTIPCNLSSLRSRMSVPLCVPSLHILTEKYSCSISLTNPLFGVDMLKTRLWPCCWSSLKTSKSAAFMSMMLPPSSTSLSLLSNLFTWLGKSAKGLVGREGQAACQFLWKTGLWLGHDHVLSQLDPQVDEEELLVVDEQVHLIGRLSSKVQQGWHHPLQGL